MKRRVFIGLLLLIALAACHSPEVPPSYLGSPLLQSLDSLLQQRPDSALQCLLACRDAMIASPDTVDSNLRRIQCVSTTGFDDHYAHLLLAEALYKNDYAQVNREELLQAVAYFDSLCYKNTAHHVATDPTIAFLTARAHYINGVGHYEQDSVIAACKEYLKVLDMMENNFDVKNVTGTKAKFMTYTYNRLGDLFNEQLLANPAIACYKQALFYCKREPTSKFGVPALLYNLGIQFDIANQKDSAGFYYDEALANLHDFDNIHYRDIIASKALLAYNRGICIDSVIKDLEYVVSLATDNEERITRFLTLGSILFENKQYDSSLVYLETVFEQQEDILSKILAAENLSSIYQMKGDSIRARQYSSFLAAFTMPEIERKADVSRINEMFQNYLTQKQKKEAEKEREKVVKKAIGIIIPIAVLVVLAVVIASVLRNKKLLKKHQEEANRMLGETEQAHKQKLGLWQAEAEKTLEEKEKKHKLELEAKEAASKKELVERDKRHAESIEAERQAHRMKQAAIAGRLKRKNQEVRELKDQIKQLDGLTAKTETDSSFKEEHICRLIMERVSEGQFKSKIDYIFYKDYALNKQQLLDLRLAVDRHFGQFTFRLKKAYPELTNSDLDYCCLYLLGLTDADIAALMQRTYNTVFERNSKIRRILGSENPLPITLAGMANDTLFV